MFRGPHIVSEWNQGQSRALEVSTLIKDTIVPALHLHSFKFLF